MTTPDNTQPQLTTIYLCCNAVDYDSKMKSRSDVILVATEQDCNIVNPGRDVTPGARAFGQLHAQGHLISGDGHVFATNVACLTAFCELAKRITIIHSRALSAHSIIHRSGELVNHSDFTKNE